MITAIFYDGIYVPSKAEGLIDLKWEVPPDGFTILEGGYWKTIGLSDVAMYLGDFICPLVDGQPFYYWTYPNPRVYSPMGVPGLHRLFGDIDASYRGIQKFCSKYGLLGSNLLMRTKRLNSDPEDEFEGVIGESIDGILRQLLRVRAFNYMLDVVKAKGVSVDLSLHYDRITEIMNGKDGRFIGDIGEQFREYRDPDIAKGITEPCKSKVTQRLPLMNEEDGNPTLGLISVSNLIMAGRQGSVGGLLEHLLQTELDEHTRTSIRVDGTPQITFHPVSLLGAIYLHLALELTGQTGPIRRCPSCQSWFEAAHMRNIYCHDRCKTKASRNRRKNPK